MIDLLCLEPIPTFRKVVSFANSTPNTSFFINFTVVATQLKSYKKTDTSFD